LFHISQFTPKKYRGAAPFKNKGWPLWNDMKSLIPGTAKGKHVFRAGSQLSGTASGSTHNSQSMLPLQLPSPISGDARSTVSTHNQQQMPLPVPPMQTGVFAPLDMTQTAESLMDMFRSFSAQSAPPTSSDNTVCNTLHPPANLSSSNHAICNTPPASDVTVHSEDEYIIPSSSSAPASYVSSGKRKYSALGPSDSPSGLGSSASYPSGVNPFPSSAIGSSQKKSRSAAPRTTGPNALLHLSNQLDTFNTQYRANMLQTELHAQAAFKNNKDTRIREARLRAQEQEMWLGFDRLAALFDVFQNTREADAYLLIENEEFRKAWVRRKITQCGFPEMSERD
jgi:hypothetical protein